MATSVTQSLFGMTPQSIQAQRDADLQAQALRFAQLTPMQQAQMGLFTAGSRLGTGIAQALGAEDPEMAQARARQGLLGGLDMSNPQALREAARMADPATAQMLINQALDVEKQLADVGAAQALAAQRSREANPVLELIKAGKYTPESVAKYQESGKIADLQLTESGPKFSNDAEEVARELYGKAFSQLTPGEAAAVNTLRNQRTVQQRGATAPKVSVVVGAPDTRGKAFEKADTDTLAGLRTSATAAAGQLGLIQQARDQVASSAVAGTGVPSVVRSLNNVLAPLGINAEQVANTRNLEQALNSIIAQGIKQYGANPSTVDLEFAKRASASITDPKLAIQQTLDYLEQRANEIVNKTDAAEQYLLDKGNLAGFEKQWINQSRISRLTGQDREAYNWAIANPNDPRSADIKKRLGVQ